MLSKKKKSRKKSFKKKVRNQEKKVLRKKSKTSCIDQEKESFKIAWLIHFFYKFPPQSITLDGGGRSILHGLGSCAL